MVVKSLIARKMLKRLLALAGVTPSALIVNVRTISWPPNWFGYARYWCERSGFKEVARRNGLVLPPFSTYPCLKDRVSHTPVLDLHYFYQDSWGARQVARVKPALVIDVGSSATLLSAVSQFVPVVSVDIRPLPVEIPNLESRKGSIVELPFESESVEFLMSLCVIEHIGLGRYMAIRLIQPASTKPARSFVGL